MAKGTLNKDACQWMRTFLLWASLLTYFAIPLALFYYFTRDNELSCTWCKESNLCFLIFTFYGLFTLWIGYWLLKKFNRDAQREFIQEVEFILINAKHTFFLAVGVACIVTSLYLIATFDRSVTLAERNANVLKVFTTFFALVFGLQILYRKNAPITSWNKLLQVTGGLF